jgi:hypothetical protein
MSQVAVTTLPSQVTPLALQRLLEETSGRQALLERIIAQFERRYGCSLKTLEMCLERREIEEHPTWEDSIEWRDTVEPLQTLKLNRSILTWLNNLLAQSPALLGR